MAAEDTDRLKRLRELRRQVDLELSDSLLVNTAPLAKICELRERRALLDEAIAQCSPQKSLVSRPIVWNALIVATLLIAAATIPTRAVRFDLEAESGSVSFDSSISQALTGFPDSTEFRLSDGCGSLSSSLEGLAASVSSLELSGQALSLRSVSFGEGSHVTITPQPSALYVAIQSKNAPVDIALEFSGTAQAVIDGHKVPWGTSEDGAEWVTFSSAKPGGGKTVFCAFTLVLPPGSQAHFIGLQVSAVQFVEPGSSSDGLMRATSSLKCAEISVENVEKAFTLNAGDGLLIEELRSEFVDLKINGKATVALAGIAGKLAIRRGPTRSSLIPSIFDYLARDKTVPTLWGALVFLWGTTVWLRKRG